MIDKCTSKLPPQFRKELPQTWNLEAKSGVGHLPPEENACIFGLNGRCPGTAELVSFLKYTCETRSLAKAGVVIWDSARSVS